MRTRNKVLLAVGGAILLFYVHSILFETRELAISRDTMSVMDLQVDNSGINDEYFNGELPKDVIIAYEPLKAKALAQTYVGDDGKFHIVFNSIYSNPPRYGVLTLEHETCHVKTWGEEERHGRHWRACMFMLESKDAFRDQLIDKRDGDQ